MILGIDIGGTNIKFGIVDEGYSIIKRDLIPTFSDKGDQGLVNSIIEKTKKLYKDYPFKAIGIGTPGTIDMDKGVCLRASNLPYNNTPLAEMIQTEMHMPVKIVNDATAAACGELYAGAGKDCGNFIMLTLGTGIGGGVVINHKPYFGAKGGAGEFGHFILKYDGILCPCGQWGCFEQYASVNALIRQTEEMVRKNPSSILAKYSGHKISGRTAFDAMRAGCEVAISVIESYTEYVALGITSLTRIFQPEKVILGGAISKEGDFLLEPIRKKLFLPVSVVSSSLGNDAGVIGAAGIVNESDCRYY